MRNGVLVMAAGLAVSCARAATPLAWDAAADRDSLRTWVSSVEAAFDRFEGCGGGDAARALYAADTVVMTTDSATMAIPGEALTALFRSVACTRRESAFRLDSVIVRPLAPGIGVATATYLETTTDTLNASSRLRGSVSWVVRQTDQGWKAAAAAVTEHRSPLP